jgi:hypothetical protein
MMPPDLFLDRKQRELRFKLSSLPLELEHWRKLAQSHRPLAKNHSQLDRVTFRIEGFQKKVEKELDEAIAAGSLWTRAQALENKALMIHMLWDFFRTRFSLRTVPPFDRYLALADAYARACYEPAIRVLKNIPESQLCAAPLVSFNDQTSPWATASEEPTPEAETANVITATQFTQAIRSMPVAIVGVPWSYLTYLPHMALLAHEAAHTVEQDGGLDLGKAITEARLKSNDHSAAWQSWIREVFADLFACWMAGPSFVWSLADYLASDQASIAKQTRPRSNGDWTAYPTATLRIRFGCHILEKREFADDASQIRETWQTTYPGEALRSFEDDFDEITACLSKEARLDSLRPVFTLEQLNIATMNAKLLAAGAPLRVDPQLPQFYVAAARLLMSNRDLRDADLSAFWEQLLDHYVTTKSPALAGATLSEPKIDADEERRQGELLAALF